MRIGIDARTILNPKKGEAIGSGHYTYQLIKNLLEVDKSNEYVLFFDFRVREKDVRKFSRPNTTIRFYPFSDYRKFLPGAYNEILTAATLAKEKLDVLHTTSPVSRIPTTYNGKVIVTFHDMGIYKVPECYSTATILHNKVSYQLMAKKADKIIAVSDSIKKDLEEIFGAGKKTQMIHCGLDKRFFAELEAGDEKILEKLGVDKKYILFLGTIEPSKNITRLLQAFAEFKNKSINNKGEKNNSKFAYQLLLVGKNGWLAKEYWQIAKDLKIEKDVIFAGYIIGDELLPILKKAEFLILPSLYEGFGMTVLESFAAGLPVIASDIPSIKEVAGEAARLVNPRDVSGITEAMLDFSSNLEMRNKLAQKGLERAKDFDWEKVAQETLEVYNKVVGR